MHYTLTKMRKRALLEKITIITISKMRSVQLGCLEILQSILERGMIAATCEWTKESFRPGRMGERKPKREEKRIEAKELRKRTEVRVEKS